MTYRPAPVTQRDGSALANSNCRMASIATGLDYQTLGDQTSTGAKMRSYQDDQSGGTDSGDADRAWANGYDQDLRVRDGYTFDDALDDLRAGRLVHLDVWAAKVGGPCLSGSGAYGHTIAVLPDQHSDGDHWLVADPWCSPPKWSWVLESKLRAGAEYWGSQVYSLALDEPDYPTGGPGPTDPRVLLIVRRIVKRLMTLYDPAHPAPRPPGRDTGGGAILYTTTKIQEVDEMAERPLYSATGKLLTIPPGTKHYEYPGGPQTGTIGDPAGTTVYRIVAQDAGPGHPTSETPSWYLIDGGAPGRMRWIYRGDVD